MTTLTSLFITYQKVKQALVLGIASLDPDPHFRNLTPAPLWAVQARQGFASLLRAP